MPEGRPPRLFLDHAATSPLLPEAREAMLPWLDSGNPSSLYAEGRSAKAAIDEARETLSQALGCEFGEAIFTSGGTEAAVLALLGAAIAATGGTRNRILVGAAEHPCVLETRPLLQRLGYRVETVGVTREAMLDLSDLERKLGDDVLLVSCMHANNELGTWNPVTQVAELAKSHGALVHTDAVQTFRVPWRGAHWTVPELGVDLLSVSGHKIGGPKGVGALFVRAGTPLASIHKGGGQERELRGGTENVAAIAGFAAAIRAVPDPVCAPARDAFEDELVSRGAIPSVRSAERLPGHCHVRIPGRDAETLLIRLDREGIAASSGSACSSGSVEPSHVMLAAGYSATEAREGLRFTLARTMGVDDARRAARRVAEAIGLEER